MYCTEINKQTLILCLTYSMYSTYRVYYVQTSLWIIASSPWSWHKIPPTTSHLTISLSHTPNALCCSGQLQVYLQARCMMLGLISENVDILLCLSIYSFLLQFQPQRNADIINRSMAFFILSYGFLKYTRLFHPSKPLKLHVEAEWRSRVVGFFHAVVLVIGSFFCFSEWPYSGNDGWTVTNPEAYYYPEIFASIFAGYLQYDLLWLLKNKKDNFDFATLIHHVVYL